MGGMNEMTAWTASLQFYNWPTWMVYDVLFIMFVIDLIYFILINN